MKNKVILFVVLLLMVFVLTTKAVVAAVTQSPEPLAGLTEVFASLGSLALVVPVIVQFIKRWIELESDFAKQLTAWIVAFGLVVLGKVLSLGFLVGIDWIETLLYGLALGLISNGVFDIAIIKSFLQTIFGLRK